MRDCLTEYKRTQSRFSQREGNSGSRCFCMSPYNQYYNGKIAVTTKSLCLRVIGCGRWVGSSHLWCMVGDVGSHVWKCRSCFWYGGPYLIVPKLPKTIPNCYNPLCLNVSLPSCPILILGMIHFPFLFKRTKHSSSPTSSCSCWLVISTTLMVFSYNVLNIRLLLLVLLGAEKEDAKPCFINCRRRGVRRGSY